MYCVAGYTSPLGEILLAADERGLTGLWFEGQKYFAAGLAEAVEGETELIKAARRWLDIYFSGREPDFTPPLHMPGTPFRERVWAALLEIPYGETATYGELAARLGSSPRAVGAAVGRNPVSLIVPCHRVLGADGSLTGYAGGVERKEYLLKLEGCKPLKCK